MSNRNYMVYADLDFDRSRIFQVLTKLDTGAGPSFVSRGELPDELDKQIRHGPLPDICDANSKPILILSKVMLSVKLGSYLSQVQFVVF